MNYLPKDLNRAANVPDACALITAPEGHRFYADLSWPVARRLMGL